jgi:hypothetical protein
MTDEAIRAAQLLDDVDALRHRVHRDRYPYAWWAGLIAAVAAVGAVGFVLNDQIETRSCQDAAGIGSVCTQSTSGFNGWWVWAIAAVAALAVSLWRRHQRGTWRPSWQAILVAVLSVYLLLPLVQEARFVPAFLYPAGAALTVALLAARRRDVAVAAVSVGVSVAIGVVWWKVDAQWFINRNAGLAALSLTAALLAVAVSLLWRRQDRP